MKNPTEIFVFVLVCVARRDTKHYIKFNDQRCILIDSVYKAKEGEAAPCTQVKVKSSVRPGGTGTVAHVGARPPCALQPAEPGGDHITVQPAAHVLSRAKANAPRPACSAQH